MNKLIFLLTLTVVTTGSVFSQTNPVNLGNPYYTPGGNIRNPQETQMILEMYRIQNQNIQYDRLRRATDSSTASRDSTTSYSIEIKRPKADSKLAAKINAPNDLETKNFGEFFKSSKTGVLFLTNGSSCGINSECRESLRSSDTELLEVFPGNGFYYSFRQRNFTTADYSDIAVYKNWIYGIGLATQSVFADLGDTPIETVSLTDAGLKYVNEFVPLTTLTEAEKQRSELLKSVVFNDHLYSIATKLALNHTYVLRSVAYDGKLEKVTYFGDRKFKYDLLNGDKRDDIVVVFRVVDIDKFENIRLVWKELSRKNAPKMKFSGEESRRSN